LRREVPFSLSYLARDQDFEAGLALRAGVDGLIGENQSRAGYDNFAYPGDECIGDAGLARHLRDVRIVCGRFAIDSLGFSSFVSFRFFNRELREFRE
jgi:hypothetical protein